MCYESRVVHGLAIFACGYGTSIFGHSIISFTPYIGFDVDVAIPCVCSALGNLTLQAVVGFVAVRFVNCFCGRVDVCITVCWRMVLFAKTYL